MAYHGNGVTAKYQSIYLYIACGGITLTHTPRPTSSFIRSLTIITLSCRRLLWIHAYPPYQSNYLILLACLKCYWHTNSFFVRHVEENKVLELAFTSMSIIGLIFYAIILLWFLLRCMKITFNSQFRMEILSLVGKDKPAVWLLKWDYLSTAPTGL